MSTETVIVVCVNMAVGLIVVAAGLWSARQGENHELLAQSLDKALSENRRLVALLTASNLAKTDPLAREAFLKGYNRGTESPGAARDREEEEDAARQELEKKIADAARLKVRIGRNREEPSHG